MPIFDFGFSILDWQTYSWHRLQVNYLSFYFQELVQRV